MEAHLVVDEINAVSSHHVEGSMSDVYNAGNTKDERKPNGEKSVYTPTDEAAYDDVQNESHIPSLKILMG
jgi:hypothetical protein